MFSFGSLPFIGAPSCPSMVGSALGRIGRPLPLQALSRTYTDLRCWNYLKLFAVTICNTGSYLSWPFSSKKTSLSPLAFRSSDWAKVLKCSVLPCSMVTSNSSAILGPIKKCLEKNQILVPCLCSLLIATLALCSACRQDPTWPCFGKSLLLLWDRGQHSSHPSLTLFRHWASSSVLPLGRQSREEPLRPRGGRRYGASLWGRHCGTVRGNRHGADQSGPTQQHSGTQRKQPLLTPNFNRPYLQIFHYRVGEGEFGSSRQHLFFWQLVLNHKLKSEHRDF